MNDLVAQVSELVCKIRGHLVYAFLVSRMINAPEYVWVINESAEVAFLIRETSWCFKSRWELETVITLRQQLQMSTKMAVR